MTYPLHSARETQLSTVKLIVRGDLKLHLSRYSANKNILPRTKNEFKKNVDFFLRID